MMAEYRVNVLIIDEDTEFLAEAASELSRHFTVYTSATGGNGLKVFAQLRPQVVIVTTGISAPPFATLLDNLKRHDGTTLRIATSHDYSAIEKVVHGIDTGRIHKYFRKPINYGALVESINARTVSYQISRGIQKDATIRPAYAGLHHLMEKVKKAETLRQQWEPQAPQVRGGEPERPGAIKETAAALDNRRKKMVDSEAPIVPLSARHQEPERSKKSEIARGAQELAALRRELQAAQEENARLVREQAELRQHKTDLPEFREAFAEEQQRAIQELELLKAELEKERQAKLTEIEAVQERGQQELADVRAELAEEKVRLEKTIQEQRERSATELRRYQQVAATQQQQLTETLEAKFTAMKQAAEGEKNVLRALASRESDRLKAVQQQERELSETVTQVRRMAEVTAEHLKLAEGQIKAMDAEMARSSQARDLALRELVSVRADFELVIQSRAALLEEMAELRNRLQ